MDKNTEYILGAFLIILFSLAIFSLNITGMAGKESKTVIELTDNLGAVKTTFERGDILKATVTVGKEPIDNRYMWIYKYKGTEEARVQGTAKSICGAGDSLCKTGTYTVTYRIEDTADKFSDGEYFIRVKEHNGDYVSKNFAIEGPKLGAYREGVYYG